VNSHQELKMTEQRERLQGTSWRSWTRGVAIALGLTAAAWQGVAAQTAGPLFILSGIIIDSNGTARAVLEEAQLTAGRSVMLRVGDTLGPYRLASIATDHAVIEGPAGALRVPLSGISGPAVVQAPAANGPAVAAPAPAPTPISPVVASVVAQQVAPVKFTEEEYKQLVTPPPPGAPYRHASQGVSAPHTRPPAIDVEDFKRQVEQHMISIPR
jgi:hypothetical protein